MEKIDTQNYKTMKTDRTFHDFYPYQTLDAPSPKNRTKVTEHSAFMDSKGRFGSTRNSSKILSQKKKGFKIDIENSELSREKSE